MPSESQIKMIQERISAAIAAWSEALPKFRAFEAHGQDLRAQVLSLDGNAFGVFRFYVELSELNSLLACCDAYDQGQRQTSAILERRHSLEPEQDVFSLALTLHEVQKELLHNRTEADRTIFHAWESHWQERDRLLTGAARVWGRRSCGALGPLWDGYDRTELDALLAPYCL